MNSSDDIVILHDLRIGKEKAFSIIFHRYYHRLCQYASNFVDETKEAEDIVEEAFVNMWNSNKDFQSMLHLKSSLYQTTRRIGINKQLSRKRSVARTEAYAANQEVQQESQLHQIVYAESMGELYEAISQLPERAQQIIKLTYFDGKSNQEVATLMGIQIQTVKNQKLRALSLLRSRLQKKYFDFLIAFGFLIEKF